MVWLLARHEVKDYKKWKPVFDETVDWIKEAGGKQAYVMRDTCCANMIGVGILFDTKEQAEGFLGEARLKDAMQRAGVIGAPEVHYFEVLDHCDL